MLVGENELRHYGVLGMKWGVRHDRKRSGAGSKRKAEAKRAPTPKSTAKAKVPLSEAGGKRAASKVSQMSDAELNRQIRRLQQEREYNRLTNEVRKPRRTAAKNMAAATAKSAASNVASALTSAAIIMALSRAFDSTHSKDLAELGEMTVAGLRNKAGVGKKKQR